MLKTTLIMLTWNAPVHTKLSIESLYRATQEFELIICDNGSDAETINLLDEYAKKYNNLRLIKNRRNLGLYVARNQALKYVKTDLVGTLDSDTYFPQGWLEKIELYFDDKNIGQVAPVKTSYNLIHPVTMKNLKEEWLICQKSSDDPVSQLKMFCHNQNFDTFSAGVCKINSKNNENIEIPTRSLSMCAMITRTKLFKDHNYNDPSYARSLWGMEDIDYSWSIYKSNRQVVKSVKTYVHHFEHASLKSSGQSDLLILSVENEEYFAQKWMPEIVAWIKQCRLKGKTVNEIKKDELIARLFRDIPEQIPQEIRRALG